MTADEAKLKVLSVHPRAYQNEVGTVFCDILLRGNRANISLGSSWIRAASKLPTPIPTPASEAFSDNFSEAAAFAGITFSQGCQFLMKMNHLTGKGTEPGFLVTPSTEESGEPGEVEEDGCEVPFCTVCGSFTGHTDDCQQPRKSASPASESADYLRGKLDGFNEGVEAAAVYVEQSEWAITTAPELRQLKRGNS